MYKIPLFNINFDSQEERAVLETVNSGWISTGPRTVQFEEDFSKLLKVPYAIALSNCTVALHLAMILAGVEEGDEVLCPSLTFVATCNAIRYVKAAPVFVDIESTARPVISANDILSKIGPKTKAIVVMHYAGFPCDMDAIMKIAKDHNLKVIEDSCHAPLSEYKGTRLGTIGDIGCFSFFSNKNISTGEGGMLVTKDVEIHNRAKLLRSHGMTTMSYERSRGHSTTYDVIEFGYNYRMDDIRASLGISQLQKIEKDLILRASVRSKYLDLLGDFDDLIIPFKGHKEFCSNYIFPIVLRDASEEQRDLLRKFLAVKGIQTSVHYPAVHRFSVYSDYSTPLKCTEAMANSMVTLPMYATLKDADLKYIACTIKYWLDHEYKHINRRS